MHKTETPTISVIVPVYNVERYLPMCLESIVQQCMDDYEVILVNDGSTDSSGAICDEFAAKHSEFRNIYQKNQGVASARNRGVEEAKGEYILFLDSDDYLVPGTISRLLQLATKNKLDVLGFGYNNVAENDIVTEIKANNVPEDIEVLNGVDYISHFNYTAQVWWYLVRRELIMKNNLSLPEGHILEEAGFNLRLFLYAERMSQVSTIAYCYRNRATSIMHDNDKDHVSEMLDDYLYAAQDMDSIIEEKRNIMSDECYERSRTRRDSYVLFGAIRAFKLGKVKEYLKEAKSLNIYPFERLSEKDYPGAKFKLLHWLVTKPRLWRFLSSVYNTFV